jgi:hypothetical protein
MVEWDVGSSPVGPRRPPRPRADRLTGNLNAIRTGIRSSYMAPIYRALPPQTRPFLQTATALALATTLSGTPPGRTDLARRERRRARLRALYGIVELLGAVDFSVPTTKAGVHLAVVRAMAPVFLDPSFLHAEFRPLPVEWPRSVAQPSW